jgi:hypothetical protein
MTISSKSSLTATSRELLSRLQDAWSSRYESHVRDRAAVVASSSRAGASMLIDALGSRLFTPSQSLQAQTEIELVGTVGEPRRPEIELRDVRLRREWDSWPAGTRGVIVDAFSHDATVEIADRDGRTLALLTLPYEALDLSAAC